MGGQYIQWAQRQAHQPYLDELCAYWDGSRQPDRTFRLESQDDAIAFFHEYQRAMGEDPRRVAGPHVQYVRDYMPGRQEILIFAGAYLCLRRGSRARAALDLAALNLSSAPFVDPWVWRTATTDDPQERLRYLQRATAQDVAHPLARDALALAEGRVQVGRDRPQETIVVTQCPQCGAGLRYEPGAAAVSCPHCGHAVAMQQVNLLDGQARAVHNLRLERRYQGHTWSEAERVVHCQQCGAELTMTDYLAHSCAFCGSTHVLVQANRRLLEQPDGLLPFCLDREQAGEALDRALKGISQRLLSWLSGGQKRVGDLAGTYLPFWVFDGIVEAYRFTQSIVTTSKESLGLSTFENLIFPASDVPPPALVSRIYPFELQALVPYDPRFLASWPARLYNRDVELVSEAARNSMAGLARQQTALTLPPVSTRQRSASRERFGVPDTGNMPQISYQVVGTTYQLILLPVWLARLEGEDGISLALVNGQSGQVAFESGSLAG